MTVAILHILLVEVAACPESALGVEHDREVEALEVNIGRETTGPARVCTTINLLIIELNAQFI